MRKETRALAAVLKGLVTLTCGCNLLTLPLVHALVRRNYIEGQAYGGASLWQDDRAVVLILFLWFCGCCTAVILWQGRRVLGAILREEPFSMDNAVSLRRAALCAFAIAGAAAARMLWGFWFYRSIAPLLTYNALFVPIFAMAGLLCLVMSALFRQAAELKAENDLTI